MSTRRFQLAALGAATLLLTACGHMGHSGHAGPMGEGMRGHGPSASATLQARSGSNVSGTVMFMQHGDHVMVHVKASGLNPGQEHGFHIHDKGDCSAPDGMSTGGHFNPTGKPHGPQAADHHGGDMPSLKADASGNASAQFHLTGVTVAEGPTSIVGRGLIVHKDPDDYKTQPTGNAGARIACAVITKS